MGDEIWVPGLGRASRRGGGASSPLAFEQGVSLVFEALALLVSNAAVAVGVPALAVLPARRREVGPSLGMAGAGTGLPG